MLMSAMLIALVIGEVLLAYGLICKATELVEKVDPGFLVPLMLALLVAVTILPTFMWAALNTLEINGLMP